MQEINIYKTSQNNFQKIFTKLVESIVIQNKKIYLLCQDHEEETKFDNLLWSYSQLSFIPHGTTRDPYPSDQLLLIGSNPYKKPENNPEVLLAVDSQKYFSDKDIVQFLINQYGKFLLFNTVGEKACLNTTSLFIERAKVKGIAINLVEQDSQGKWLKHPL